MGVFAVNDARSVEQLKKTLVALAHVHKIFHRIRQRVAESGACQGRS
jgi:hypothetical protein